MPLIESNAPIRNHWILTGTFNAVTGHILKNISHLKNTSKKHSYLKGSYVKIKKIRLTEINR